MKSETQSNPETGAPVDSEMQSVELTARLTLEQEAIIRKVAQIVPTWKMAMLLREVDALRAWLNVEPVPFSLRRSR